MTNYVSIGAPPLTNAWTAEFWVFPLTTNHSSALLASTNTALKLEQNVAAHQVGFTQYGVEDYAFNYSAPTNAWVHLAFVSNTNNTTQLYVNGSLQDTLSNTIALPMQEMGAHTNSVGLSDPLPAILDEVRIWDVALNQTQIQAGMFQPLTGTEPCLVAYYNFNEGSGTIAHDATTNQFNGTLVPGGTNGPTWVVSTVPFPFTYTTNDGTITITGYTGYTNAGAGLSIPGTINGLPVTSIGSNAFSKAFNYFYSITSVTIPDGVTNIGDDAFYFCSGLTNVTIPNSVTSIGTNAFAECFGLTSVAIPDSVTSIGDSAFYDCTSLTSVKIPNSVISIGDTEDEYGVFGLCSSLTSVTIGNSVTSIGDYAFSYCSGLTNVTIGAGVTAIGDYAFGYCPNLTGVYFRGNAPGLGIYPSVFYSSGTATSYPPTIYYLPGTTGWYNGFDDLEALLWNPQAQSFGMLTNGFGFTITGTANIPIVVEACTNLAGGAWTPLQTCTVTNGSIYFCDPQGTNYPARFYRISAP